MPLPRARIGCAGWSLPRELQPQFGDGASHLQRYATRFDAAEINSSFHRAHAAWVWQRWAESVPDTFRFSVKLPRTITHDRKLADCGELLRAFLRDAHLLGGKLGCLLVQLPPSLAFDHGIAQAFFAQLRALHEGLVAVEPRHASWFEAQADSLLAAHQVARVLADPVRVPAGSVPGGWPQWIYVRLHGSPRMYYSAYDTALIEALAARIAQEALAGRNLWCIFDNTAAGAAAGNALQLQHALAHLRVP